MSNETLTKDQQRYCIGCVHLSYEGKQTGCGSTYTGEWTMEEASMRCGKGYWKHYLSVGEVGFDFEKAMEHAGTCCDYQERET